MIPDHFLQHDQHLGGPSRWEKQG